MGKTQNTDVNGSAVGNWEMMKLLLQCSVSTFVLISLNEYGYAKGLNTRKHKHKDS